MPEVALSTGTIIHSENIERAEYYPANALDSYGCHFGGPEMRECPFLFVQTKGGATRITGEEAGTDADALERAGVTVIRHPVENRLPPM